MRLLDENPSISTREIAEKVGISNGAAYYCVTALVEKGFVKLKNFTQSKTKAKYIYELTPRGIRAKAALTVSFLERKRHEYEGLKVEIERLESELGITENVQRCRRRRELGKNLTCFKAYDVRGKLGEEFDEGIAYRIGRATVQSQGAKIVVVGFDARATSSDLVAVQTVFAMAVLTSCT